MQQDRTSLVLFDKYCEFEKMRVKKYMNDQLLKLTETSTVVEIENPGTEVAKNKAAESGETQIEANLVKCYSKNTCSNVFMSRVNLASR